MPTINLSVSNTWTLVLESASNALLSCVEGYGDICQSDSMPSNQLRGHVIQAGAANNAFQASGKIYARAHSNSGNMLLAVTQD
ncbi:hypothetical protein ACP3TC_04945 [Winslowiella sp. 2C04]|uniref:hypothetical protein n=1 Tax=Winslowiella sp. 2C04 TaxID=3416179 RepID=UPI003CE8F24C